MTKKRYEQCILVSAYIPWDENFIFDRGLFVKLLRHICAEGYRFIYLFGSAGEGYALTDSQYEEIVAVFAQEAITLGFRPQIGVISLSEQQIKQRVEVGLRLGVREFQISMPPWHALSDIEVSNFFHDICDNYPEASFINYNLPRTKRLLTVDELTALASEIPNLVGAKFMTNDMYIVYQMAYNGGPLRFWVGEAAFAYACVIGGDVGFLPSSCNLRRTKLFYDACIAGDWGTVSAELPLQHAKFSVLEKSFPYWRIDGAYDKMLTRVEIKDFPLRLLPPYEYCSEVEFELFLSKMREECPSILPERLLND